MKAIYIGNCILGSDFLKELGMISQFIISCIVSCLALVGVFDQATQTTLIVFTVLVSTCCISLFIITGQKDAGLFPSEARQKEQVHITENTQLEFHHHHFDYDNSCYTCAVSKPPGTSHCAFCDHCVVLFDHCCPWIGGCIGIRNYFYYLLCLVSIIIFCLYTIVQSIVVITLSFTRKYNNPYFNNIWATCLLSAYMFICAWGGSFTIWLSQRHVRRLLKNVTSKGAIVPEKEYNMLLHQSCIDDLEALKTEFRQRLGLKINEKYIGFQRAFYGRKFPILRGKSILEAQDIAWMWTIALSK